MADVRCPNCEKTNPEGRDFCAFCDFPLPSAADMTPEEQERTPAVHEESPPPAESETQRTEDWESPGDSEEEGDAGWLDVLHASEEEPPSQEQTPPQDEEEKEEIKAETDWLQRIRDLDVEEQKEEEPPQEGDAFPAWMTEEEVEPKEPSPEEKKEELPDWLKPDEERVEEPTEEEPEATPQVLEEEEEKVPEEEEREVSEPPPSEEKLPSWATEAEPPGEEEAAPEPQKDIEPFQMDQEEEDIDDLFDEELPSWLTAADEEESLEIGDDISPGELPGWVEAMQPVVESSDTSGLAEDEEYIENYGPLAGIPSVLPAEPEMEQIDPEEKAAHMLDLSVTKAQRDYASLLKDVISQENKIKPITKQGKLPTQRILRWLIALLLLLSVGASIIAGGGGSLQPPEKNPQGNAGYAEMHGMVETLQEGDTALIVFDYQPALAGELEATAAGVVDHIISRKAYLSLISTQPTGPSLGEHFLSHTQADHNYQHGKDYINLGYLPGQAAGILGFSTSPQEIIPIAFNGGNAWDSPPLRDIENLADFSLILILTDDPTTARIWIEQIIPFTTKEMIGMVVGAQAAPLVRPYFENSPQLISGLVAGLRGGKDYESLIEAPNRASAYWLPLNVGIIVTLLTVFIGGLVNGILNLIQQHQSPPQQGGPHHDSP